MPVMIFRRSRALGLLLACRLISACGEVDPEKGPGGDFNPLPDSAEYVYAKEFRYSSGMTPGWSCIDTVRRNPVAEAASPGRRRFLDSNTIHCAVVGYSQEIAGVIDTIREEIASLDTISFSETPVSLTMTDADAFLNVALPSGVMRQYPDGLRRSSRLITEATVSFPKSGFPVVQTPYSQDAAQDCGYVEVGRTSPCRKLISSDFRYQSEVLAFLQGTGFISLQSSDYAAPLGTGSQETGSIRLLYRVLHGDTLWYKGNVSP
ncbi:MAG: hypothetical protein JF616_18115 [Fibrobacteres bacterium]|nr:hypothetical protein [Fibrobacterota bacterium]